MSWGVVGGRVVAQKRGYKWVVRLNNFENRKLVLTHLDFGMIVAVFAAVGGTVLSKKVVKILASLLTYKAYTNRSVPRPLRHPATEAP